MPCKMICKTTKLILLSILLSSSLFAQSGHKSKLKLAKEHIRYAEYEEAIPYIQELLLSEPNSAYYNFWLGKAMYLTYRKNQALSYLDKVNEINPSVDKEFHFYYGLTLHYNLFFDRAIEQYIADLERYTPQSTDYMQVNNRITQCLYAKNLMKKREGDKVKINNMGDQVNSQYSEHSPVISANDSVLLFTARRPDCLGAQPESHYYDEDIYISYRNGDNWTEAKNIATPVNSKGHDATISLTPNGRKLYIYRHKKLGGLFVTKFDTEGKTWKEPKALEKPFNSKFYEASIAESPDGNLLYFTSDRPGGFGGRDIYVCNKIGNDKWSEPKNLGPRINTAFDEDAPYLHPDGRTLYFSSNGPTAMGGFDIFVTELQDDGDWLEPLNMGFPVNTPDDDIYFVVSASGKYGYYASGREGGKGEKDLYQLEFPYFPYPRRNHIIHLSGIIQDHLTLDTLRATIKLVDRNTNKVLDSIVTGTDSLSYFFVLEELSDYSFDVTAPGYHSATDIMKAPSLDGSDLFMRKDFLLDKDEVFAAKKEESYEIMNVYFDFDQHGLRSEYREELDQVVEFMKKNDDLTLELLGHTDWFGTYEYNLALSKKRANSVEKYLVQKGISADRVNTFFYSENEPLETNEDDTGRQYNRRTELRFYKDTQLALRSVKLKTGQEGIYVDHKMPKGLAGFDFENGIWMAEKEKEEAAGGMSSFDALAMDKTKWISSSSYTISKAEAYAPYFEALTLQHLYFDFDGSGLRAESAIELAKVVEFMEAHTDIHIELYGHTDAYGSTPYNQQLSENRCVAAFDWLKESGINPGKIVMTGFSELKPMGNNQDDLGRQKNRRVEIHFVINGEVVHKSTP